VHRLARRLPEIVIAAGAVFTLYLQSLVPGEVFTVGDAGVKFLQTRQFAAGQLHSDLRLPAEGWVRSLWRADGLYPFLPPIVFPVGDRYLPVYPPFFPLLSAPPYRLFGWRGLYLLPLVGTWATWLLLRRACRAWRAPPAATAAAVFALIFASPLTYYSATFWEHAPAVALTFAGFVLLWAQPFGRAPGRGQAFAGGALLASAAWLREETLALVGLLCGLALLRRWAGWRLLAPLGLPAVAGLVLPCVVLFAVNTALYGFPLGAHSPYVLRPTSWRQVWAVGGSTLRLLSAYLVAHFPLVAFCAAATPVLLLGRRPRARSDGARVALVLGLCALFVVAVAYAARNPGGRQWGPRFLLPVLPLLCLVAAQALAAASRRGGGWRWTAWLGFLGLAAAGVHTNTWEASSNLRTNYAARLVPYRYVLESGVRYVAVAQDSVAHQLAGAFEGRAFFLAPRGKDLRRLGEALALHGETRFLFLCYAHYGCGPIGKGPPFAPRHDLVAPDGRVAVELVDRGMLDRYAVFEALLTPPGQPARIAPPRRAQKRGGRHVTVNPP
jgi:hypothetical protein